MALPTNRIRKIKLPDDNIYDIVPSTLTDGTTSYALSVPTLTGDSTIALTSDIPDNYLTTNTNQIISATKTIKASPLIFTKSDDTEVGRIEYNTTDNYFDFYGASSVRFYVGEGSDLTAFTVKKTSTVASVYPYTDSSLSLGTTGNRWKDVHATTLKNGNATYGISIPSTASYTANKTLATTDDIPTTYLKSAGVGGTFSNILTISKQDDTLVTFYNYFHSPTYPTGAGLLIASGRGVIDLYVPYANNSQAGVVSSDSQTFAGTKTFKTAASNSYGAVMPTTSSYTSNKTIATTDLISSAEFVEVLPSTVTITFTESSSGLRTGLSIYDGSDDTGTLLYSIASGGSVTTPQTLTITSGNIFISTTGSRYTYISQGSTGGISNVVITNNGNSGVPVTLSAVVSDNGTFAISLDYDY